MERGTIQFVLLVLQIAFSLALPTQQQYRKLTANESNEGHILGEEIASADLNIQSTSKSDDEIQSLTGKNNILTIYNNPSDSNGKSENDPVDFGNEDYIAEMSGDAGAPVNSPNNVKRQVNRPSMKLPTSPITVASANPIYITIPIYLNKADGQPLRLSVAGQEIPLTPKVTNNYPNPQQSASPTSQFNRLLQQSVAETTKPQRKTRRKSNRTRKRHHTSITSTGHNSDDAASERYYPQSRNTLDTRTIPDQLVSYRFYF